MKSRSAHEMDMCKTRDSLVCGEEEWRMMKVGGVRIDRLPEICARNPSSTEHFRMENHFSALYITCRMFEIFLTSADLDIHADYPYCSTVISVWMLRLQIRWAGSSESV